MEGVNDMLIHRFVDGEDYTSYVLDFASSYVRDSILRHFELTGNKDIVSFLTDHMQKHLYGPLCGHLHEATVHKILSRGGTFKRKRVSKDGTATASKDFELDPLVLLPFDRVEQLAGNILKGLIASLQA
jgi:hypothetical protein